MWLDLSFFLHSLWSYTANGIPSFIWNYKYSSVFSSIFNKQIEVLAFNFHLWFNLSQSYFGIWFSFWYLGILYTLKGNKPVINSVFSHMDFLPSCTEVHMQRVLNWGMLWLPGRSQEISNVLMHQKTFKRGLSLSLTYYICIIFADVT